MGKTGKRTPELLAPAGNREALIGAVSAGADAVYLGGEKFGARAYADNFSAEELLWGIRYAHLHGCRVYLTLNTLVKEKEFGEIRAYLEPLYLAGLDAVLVQDMGVLCFLRRQFPDLELHISTQMTVTGAYGASLLRELGAVRVVPARELSLEELRRIRERTGMEVEVFIHGAMCYCYSGQCLLSSILGGRSGNRGRCAQPCRLPYEIWLGGKRTGQGYPLSLKDLCTLESLDALTEAGVDSLKIEGRMKRPEYAAGVTALYRKYLDQKAAGPGGRLEISGEDLGRISRLYIRSQRQTGYLFRYNGRDMVTLENPGYSGSDEALLAQIRRDYIQGPAGLPLSVEGRFFAGERARLTLMSGGTRVTVLGAELSLARNQPLTRERIEGQLEKLGDTCFTLERLSVETDQRSFCPVRELNELRREGIRQLEDALLRDNGFEELRKPAASWAGEQIPRGDMGESGREDGNVSGRPERKLTGGRAECGGGRMAFSLHLSTWEQVQALEREIKEGLPLPVSRLYVESALFLEGREGRIREKLRAVKAALGRAPGVSAPEEGRIGRGAGCGNYGCHYQGIYPALPWVMRQKDERAVQRLLEIAREDCYAGFLVRNLEEYAFLKSRAWEGGIRCDHSLYVWNREALAFWQDRVEGITCPLELSRGEWRFLAQERSPSLGLDKLLYGRIPLMITANCVARTAGQCRREAGHRGVSRDGSPDPAGGEWAFLKDRLGKSFPVELQCACCTNILYNSLPLSLHDALPGLIGIPGLEGRLSFTTESGEELGQVLRFFGAAAESAGGPGKKGASRGDEPGKRGFLLPPYGEYTTGHEKRGVE